MSEKAQDTVGKEIVLLLGAGASKDFGLPLVDELIHNFPPSVRDLYYQAKTENRKLLIEDFLQYLANVEHFEADPAGRKVLDLMGYKPGHTSGIKSLNNEIHQSIRTQCRVEDRMVSTVADIYENLINKAEATNTHMRIFTTNYDLVVERAFAQCGFKLLDGFRRNENDATSVWQNDFDYREHCLFKLHGSIGWYLSPDTGEVCKAADPDTQGAGDALLAYPMRDKPFFSEPFATLHSHYQQILRQSCAIIVVGFSFQDPNIVAPLKRQMESGRSSTKMWIVNRSAERIKKQLNWSCDQDRIFAVAAHFKDWVDNGATEWCQAIRGMDEECGTAATGSLRSEYEKRWSSWSPRST